jgi:hypothetical protein
MTSTKFKIGDPVKLGPSGTEIYVISHVHVKYEVTHPKFVGTTGLHEKELYELSTEEQAEFKKKKTEELKKNMLAAIAEYESFLKN